MDDGTAEAIEAGLREKDTDKLNFKAVTIDTNSLVVLRATKLLFTPTQSHDYILITAQYR